MGKIFILILYFLVLLACSDGDNVRKYTEDHVALRGNNKAADDTVKPDTRKIIWETPVNWMEKEARGIRLATFDIKSENQFALCTIIPLQGDGGGIKANVKRWLSQLDLNMGSEDELDNFVLRQKRFTTQQKIPATYVDFTPLLNSIDQDTMMVLILKLPQETIFLKMIGKKNILQKNREKLLSLGQSLTVVEQ
jgi:hypothetical protein